MGRGQEAQEAGGRRQQAAGSRQQAGGIGRQFTSAELSLVLHEYRYEYLYGVSGVIALIRAGRWAELAGNRCRYVPVLYQ